MWSLLQKPICLPICMNAYFFRGRFVLHLQTGNVNRSAISSGAFAVFPLEIHWIQSWNTPPCLWNSKLRYPPTSSEFQSKKPPLSLGIPRCHPWYGMDIFWNHPFTYDCFAWVWKQLLHCTLTDKNLFNFVSGKHSQQDARKCADGLSSGWKFGKTLASMQTAGNIYVSNEIYMPCIKVLINENELQFVL